MLILRNQRFRCNVTHEVNYPAFSWRHIINTEILICPKLKKFQVLILLNMRSASVYMSANVTFGLWLIFYLVCQWWWDWRLTKFSKCQESLWPLFWALRAARLSLTDNTTDSLCFLYRLRQSSQLASLPLSYMSLSQEKRKRRGKRREYYEHEEGFSFMLFFLTKSQYAIWVID